MDLAGTGPFFYGTDQNPRYTIQEGYPIYAFWGYKTNGLYQSDADAAAGPYYSRPAKAGDVNYVDMTKDGKIKAASMASAKVFILVIPFQNIRSADHSIFPIKHFLLI